MKTLLLLRHAKSSWDDSSLPDFERPLAPRGKRDAPRMGKEFASRGPAPDLVVSSPAQRARDTTTLFLHAAKIQTQLRFDDKIYEAGTAELVSLVRKMPDTAASVLMVGHNPGFEELIVRLTKSRRAVPTCSLTRIDFDVENWEAADDGAGKLVWQLNPKELQS
ncbi:MAG TPA: histidine phosphatase family protein [Blastocatellia bacterium]|nr:histidine phosphatase family protein [Blastocatellia bacterium]